MDHDGLTATARRNRYVVRTAEELGVRFVRLWFVDVLGLLKSVAVPVSELEGALEEGVGLDGSALEGSVRRRERDVIAHPDPGTFQILPWRPDALIGRMFCDVRLPDGRPFPGDSRAALKRVVERAAGLGFTLQVGAEVEFFLFAGPGHGEEPRPLDAGAYFDLTALDDGSDFRRRTIEYLEAMSIPVKASHHEVAASQHEVDLVHCDALSAADAMTTFRLVVKEAAAELGSYATFMPKPLQAHAGSGMHLHLSLFEGERNAFHPTNGEGPLAEVGRAFLAGLLTQARELTAVTNQWVNSYKRLRTGWEAPSRVCWARHADAALVRVPSNRPGKESAARIELRSPDPSCNPYLALALVLAAGLRGIERGYALVPECEDATDGSLPPLPEDLREATDLLEGSELAREVLGERLCEWYVRNKRAEWDEYQSTVTEHERARLLRTL